MSLVSSIDPPSEGSTYRPIGEVATLLRLQPHVLRFWETKFKQIAPLKRSGGRRYYRREDVRLLFQIRDLLYVEGYTLRGAQKALRAHTRSAKEDKANEQKRADASPTSHLSPAARADLLRITERLEQALARCSQEKTNEAETNEAKKHEQENHEEPAHQESAHKNADSREQ